MKVQHLVEQDKAWVLRVWKECQAELGVDPGRIWHRWVTSKNPNEQWVGVPEYGFAHFLLRRDGLKTLYEIGVAEVARRTGLGRQLLEYIGTPLHLKTDANNQVSNAFYAKLGFRMYGQSQSRAGKLSNCWCKDR